MATIDFVKASRLHDGATKPAVNKLTMTVNEGEFLAVVGPSGCGKSTTLRMVTGLEPVTSGDILIDGESARHTPPSKRDVAMVFQTYALYPHMSVAENMGFALKMRKIDKSERESRVKRAAELLDLTDYLERRPKELSGGQRQRVAMGRAIVREPKVFLMDEPLSNLDAKLRVSTRAQIAELQRKLGVTTIYVTHDQTEAMTMADRIAVLESGDLKQVGTPRELYDKPDNLFVAGFLGTPSMNFIDVELSDPRLGETPYVVPQAVQAACPQGRITLGLRPEYLRPVSVNETGKLADVEANFVEDIGSDAYVRAHLVGDESTVVTLRVPADIAPSRGERFGITIEDKHLHFFNSITSQAVR